jgi:hypothetical protein
MRFWAVELLASPGLEKLTSGLRRASKDDATTTPAPIEIKTQAGTPSPSGPVTQMHDKHTPSSNTLLAFPIQCGVSVVRIWLGVFPVQRLNVCVNALAS